MQNDTDFDPHTYGNISQSEIDNAIQNSKIKNPRETYRNVYYSQDKVRSLIYTGQKDGQDCVLKIWNDPRETYEPLDLAAFNKINQSTILKAPQILGYAMPNIHQGWILMEKIDTSQKLYDGHPTKENKQKHVELYIEYRKNFPHQPAHEVPAIEKLSAAEYHLARIDRWDKLAKQKNWLEEKYYDLINQIKQIIKQKFTDIKMIWGQNMFFNDNIYKVGESQYYLFDFQHVGYKPQGYELAMIVWKALMESIERYKTISNQADFDHEIEEWFEVFEENNLIDRDLFNSSMLERSCGTILADISASDREEAVKKLMLKLWEGLLLKK